MRMWTINTCIICPEIGIDTKFIYMLHFPKNNLTCYTNISTHYRVFNERSNALNIKTSMNLFMYSAIWSNICFKKFVRLLSDILYGNKGLRLHHYGSPLARKDVFLLSRSVMRLNHFIFIKHVTKVLGSYKIRGPWTSKSSAQQLWVKVRWAVWRWGRISYLKYKYFKYKKKSIWKWFLKT